MSVLRIDNQKFHRLDRRSVPPVWCAAIHQSLSNIFQFLPSEDQKILSNFRAFMRELGPLTNTNYANSTIPSGTSIDHPVGATLLLLNNSEKSETVLRLSAILVCAALDPNALLGNGRKKLEKLAMKIRGVLKDQNSPLKLQLSEARSIPQIVQIMESGLIHHESEFKDDFGNLWSSWLRDVIIRWMRGDVDYLRLGLKPTMLVPSLDAPILSVLGTDLDDTTEIISYVVDGTPADSEEPSARARYSRAKTGLMIRTSQGDLLSDPNKYIPDEMIVRITAGAITSAEEALKSNSLSEAEPFVALALGIATALREIELGELVWGLEGSESAPVLDLEMPLLYRRICRPPSAVNPSKIPESWLESTTEYFEFPVPPKLYAMLKLLAGSGTLINGQPVLRCSTAVISSPYQLREIVKRLVPEAAIGAGRFRQVMASHLAHQFGPEIPQIIMADTFSLSAAPAYYGSLSGDRVFNAVTDIQNRWFGEAVVPGSLNERFIGSRLTLNQNGARMWSESIHKNKNSIVRRKGVSEIDAWTEHRNRLAGALVSAVGHRPTNNIGCINLDQIIPEYGLIILKDKQSDELRITRIAATGRLWLSDLRSFLNRLVRLVDVEPDSSLGILALAILRSEFPLFSLPNAAGGVDTFNAALLRATMPNELQTNDNFYRHRLNQYLQACKIDPELRHAQLGWVVSPANALADLSPHSASDLGRLIGPSIDELMFSDGWYPRSMRITRWHWQGVPMRQNIDWEQVVRNHEKDHKKNIQSLIDKLRGERKDVEKSVMPRMISAFEMYFPKLRICPNKLELLPARGYENQKNHEMLIEHYGLICDYVRQADNNQADSSEAIVARDLLYKLIKKARNNGIVMGPLPSRIYLSPKNQPSPFPPSMGLAVRQAEELKKIILQRADQKMANEGSVLAVLSVIAFSPYKSMRLAMAAVQGANRAVLGQRSEGVLRVSAKVDQKEIQLVLGGLPAVLLANRSVKHKTAVPPTEVKISNWLDTYCKDVLDKQAAGDLFVPQLVSLFRMTGRLELSGPERLIMLEHEVLATVPVSRSIAEHDRWPVQTRIDEIEFVDEHLIETYEKDKGKSNCIEPELKIIRKAYQRLTNLVNPDTKSPLDESLSDGHRAWRIKLNKELEKFIDDFGERSNLGVLAGFIRRRLLDGGDKKKKLAHNTLYKELTYFGSILLSLLGKKSLLNLTSEEFQATYLELLNGKSVSSRPHVFETLRIFHNYLIRIHSMENISFESIAEFAGPRVIRPDMGLMTNAEELEVLKQLGNDLSVETQRADTSPDLLRLCSLRIVMFHILEASGIRPGSAHGLTLGDLHFMGQGQDYVHVHRTGEYGQAKSQASIGFFKLKGEIWKNNRDWVIDWLEKEKGHLISMHWWTYPVFAKSIGAKIRFSQSYLTDRFNELFKWVSNEKNACTYWLRKNRITCMHRAAVSGDRPMARDVYRAIISSGQAGISVAVTHYISDPTVVMQHNLREANSASRQSILQTTDMRTAVLDMAWARGRNKGCGSRSQAIFKRINLQMSVTPKERLTQPPPMKRPKQLYPVHIDGYARALQHYSSRSEAILRSGLSDLQAEFLDASARMLLTVRGKSPWPLPEIKYRKAVLLPARELAGMESIYKMLDKQPNNDFKLLAEAWAAQSHIHKLYSPDVIMVLGNQELHDAAIRLFERFSNLKLVIDSEAGMPVIKKKESRLRQLGHTTTFEWLLAIFWIYTRFSQNNCISNQI